MDDPIVKVTEAFGRAYVGWEDDYGVRVGDGASSFSWGDLAPEIAFGLGCDEPPIGRFRITVEFWPTAPAPAPSAPAG